MAETRTAATTESGTATEDGGELFEALLGRQLTGLDGCAECEDAGDLVESEGCGWPLGECEAFAGAVVDADEEGGGECDDAGLAYAVGGGDAAEEQFDLGGLLAAGEVGLAKSAHEVDEGGGFFGGVLGRVLGGDGVGLGRGGRLGRARIGLFRFFLLH